MRPTERVLLLAIVKPLGVLAQRMVQADRQTKVARDVTCSLQLMHEQLHAIAHGKPTPRKVELVKDWAETGALVRETS